jgi:hypothetical protein
LDRQKALEKEYELRHEAYLLAQKERQKAQSNLATDEGAYKELIKDLEARQGKIVSSGEESSENRKNILSNTLKHL